MSAAIIQIHFKLHVIMGANTMNPDQAAPEICVHSVCNTPKVHKQMRLQIVAKGGKRVISPIQS